MIEFRKFGAKTAADRRGQKNWKAFERVMKPHMETSEHGSRGSESPRGYEIETRE